MGYWEKAGASDEWYTPAYIFDAIEENFDLDVAAPKQTAATHVPARSHFFERGLEQKWKGFVWMNPPFGGRNSLVPWLEKFFDHGHGIALTPDRTSTQWWQNAAKSSSAVLFVEGKIKFERPDGSEGKSPSNGTTLFAAGPRAAAALLRAESRLGTCWTKYPNRMGKELG